MSHGPCGRGGAAPTVCGMPMSVRTAGSSGARSILVLIASQLLLKQQLRKLMQAATPAQPLVSGLWGFVENGLDACLIEIIRVRLGGSAILAAAVTREHKFDLFLEVGHVFDLRHTDAAAAEHSNMRELIEMGECDAVGIHAAHREASHSAMRLI